MSTAAAKELTLWTHATGSELQWLESQADAFKSVFGIDVLIEQVELGEIRQRMLFDAPDGEAADLIAPIPHDQISEMALGGVLADLSDFATPDYLADYGDQARLALSYDGVLYGLPIYLEGPALILNTDLVNDPPETLEEMIVTAQNLTEANRFGFLYDISNFYFSYVWFKSEGGYVFGRDNARGFDADDIGLANSGAAVGASMVQDLRYSYNLIPEEITYNIANQLFREGDVGMIYNGSWAIPEYRDAGLRLKVMPIPPKADGTQFSGFMSVQGVMLNQFSEDRYDAVNFAKWLTRPDAQLALANAAGRIPASQSAVAQLTGNQILSGFAAALANAEAIPNIPEMGRVWGPMGSALGTILDSPGDPTSELEQTVKEIKGE